VNNLKYFTAAWCGPCRSFKPTIEELKSEGENIDIIDIDDNRSLASEYEIMSVPTLVFERSGKIYARTSGGLPKSEIKKALNWDPE
jgi:thioredoxin 1